MKNAKFMKIKKISFAIKFEKAQIDGSRLKLISILV